MQDEEILIYLEDLIRYMRANGWKDGSPLIGWAFGVEHTPRGNRKVVLG